MRIGVSVLAVVLLASLSHSTRAGENPRLLVEKAVSAMGGLERLSQKVATWRNYKGHFHDENMTFIGESFIDGKKLKIMHKSENQDRPRLSILVMEGDKGWINSDGFVFDLDDIALERMKRARHADRVDGLVTLLKDKGYTLSYVGEEKVKGKPAHQIKVSHEGQPDIHLYFDRTTGLLVKSSQKFTEPDNKDKEILHELYFFDYQPLNLAAADEKLLKDNGISIDGPALVEFIRRRTPKPEIKAQIQRLIDQLGDGSFRTRTRASLELKKLGPVAASALREALKDSDPEVLQRARELLDKLGDHPDSQLMPAALRLLALRPAKDSVPVLLGYLPWAPDEKLAEDVKLALAAAAWRNGKPDPAIVEALKSKDAMIRATANAILEKKHDALNRQAGRQVLVEGLTLPRRCEMYRDGKRHMDLETLEVRFYNRHEDRIFSRPGRPEDKEEKNPER